MRADFGTRDGVQAGPGGGAPPAGRLSGRRPAGSGDRGPGAFGRRVLPTLVLLWAFSLAVASCGGGGQGPAGASGALSLDEYLEFCGDTVTEANSLDGSGSVGEFSEAAEQAVELMEQVDPPAEVADWHNAMLAYVRALKETLDEIPQSAGGDSEEAFLVLTILELVFEHRPSFEQAISGMDPGVRSQMVDAGCIDELDAEQAASTVRPEPGDGRDAEPEATEEQEEHEEPARPEPGDGDGAEQEAADEEEEAVESEELLVGQSAEGRLDGPLEVDRFWVWAEAGEKYVLEADWRGMRNLRARISRSPGYNWIYDSEDPPFFTVWEPEVSGVYDISVESDDAPGSYTIAVSEDPRPDPPPNQRYSWDGPEVSVTWDPAQDADRYNVYFGDGGRCEVGGREQPRWCELLAADVEGAAHAVASSAGPSPYEPGFFWVEACNSEGCSGVDSGSPAVPVEAVPEVPSGAVFSWEGTAVRVSWDSAGASARYNVYYSDFFEDSCRVDDYGPGFCDELASDVADTEFLHADPGARDNYYWVEACSRGGCSGVDSHDRAAPVEPPPANPQSARYSLDGSAIRLSWDPVGGADYYTVYHDDFFDDSCSVDNSGPRFCDELATEVTDTEFLHTDPDDRENHYWVVACNRGGCSDVDSDSPAERAGG